MITRHNMSHGDFIQICELARAGDSDKLIEFLRKPDEHGMQRVVTDCKRGRHYSPITYLAMKGEHQAVEFFLEKPCTDPMDIMVHIIDGYLLGGHEKKAREYIERIMEMGKTDRSYTPVMMNQLLVKVYAANECVTEVNAILEKFPAVINFALAGYIRGHHLSHAEELLSRGASLDIAACAFAIEGDQVKVEQIWDRVKAAGGQRNYGDVMDIYETMGYFDSRYNILNILTQTRSPELRKDIALMARIYHPLNDDKELLKTANHISQLMSQYDLSYDQAKAFTSADEMTWLLQGRRFGNASMPQDVFIHITTYVTNTSNSEARKLYQQLSKHVHERALKGVEKNYAPGMVSTLFSCVWPKEHRNKVKLLADKKAELHEKYDPQGRRK